MIDAATLYRYGASSLELEKGEEIFEEGTHARFFFLIEKGEVKMNNFGEDGKEFIQGIFSEGRSFGEPPLFIDTPYPANAYTTQASTLIKLPKEKFFTLLTENRQIHLDVSRALAHKLYYKASMAPQIAHHHPENSILKLLRYLKEEVYKVPEPMAYEVELTRQQIADLTGLRTETVIKSIKEMEKQGLVEIRNRKVFL